MIYLIRSTDASQAAEGGLELPPQMRKVKVDLTTRSKYCKSLLAVESRGDRKEIEALLKPENSLTIDDVTKVRAVISVRSVSTLCTLLPNYHAATILTL
jgi:hypothetical protein